MITWGRGTRILFDKTRAANAARRVDRELEKKPPHLVPGTAVFLTSDRTQHADGAYAQPEALQGAARTQRHPFGGDRATRPCSRQPSASRWSRSRSLHAGDDEIRLHGAAEHSEGDGDRSKQGWKFDIMSTSFFLSRRSLKASPTSGMPLWQDRLFIELARTAADATSISRFRPGGSSKSARRSPSDKCPRGPNRDRSSRERGAAPGPTDRRPFTVRDLHPSTPCRSPGALRKPAQGRTFTSLPRCSEKAIRLVFQAPPVGLRNNTVTIRADCRASGRDVVLSQRSNAVRSNAGQNPVPNTS